MRSRIRVLPDGREITRGYQWQKRRRELYERAEGYCEAGEIIPDHPRHWIGKDGHAHHKVLRSKDRDDRLSAMLWICPAAHLEAHGNRSVRWTKGEKK